MFSRIVFASIFSFVMAGPGFAQDLRLVSQWPDIAPGSFGVTGSSLPDGRLILWNGSDVFIQNAPGGATLEIVATGYQGDPSFVAIAPDGYTALLGPGFSPMVYLFDTRTPTDFVAGSEIAAPNHFSGAFLNQDLVVMDRGLDDFSASELVVLDLSGTKGDSAWRSVLTFSPPPLEKMTVLDKPQGSFSSGVFVDAATSTLYVMDAGARELRAFDVADVIAAFDGASLLDWATDGILIGAVGSYFSGGVSGVTSEGYLVIGGSEGFLAPGGVQIVDPSDGMVLETLDPAGTQGFYSAIYISALDEIVAVVDGMAYASEAAIATPSTGFTCAAVSGGAGTPNPMDYAVILAAALALGWVGRRRAFSPLLSREKV